jgi:hypothetical protein
VLHLPWVHQEVQPQQERVQELMILALMMAQELMTAQELMILALILMLVLVETLLFYQ